MSLESDRTRILWCVVRFSCSIRDRRQNLSWGHIELHYSRLEDEGPSTSLIPPTNETGEEEWFTWLRDLQCTFCLHPKIFHLFSSVSSTTGVMSSFSVIMQKPKINIEYVGFGLWLLQPLGLCVWPCLFFFFLRFLSDERGWFRGPFLVVSVRPLNVRQLLGEAVLWLLYMNVGSGWGVVVPGPPLESKGGNGPTLSVGLVGVGCHSLFRHSSTPRLGVVHHCCRG